MLAIFFGDDIIFTNIYCSVEFDCCSELAFLTSSFGVSIFSSKYAFYFEQFTEKHGEEKK